MRRTLGSLSILALFTIVACASGDEVSSQQQAIAGEACPDGWYETPVPAEFGIPYATLGDILPTYYLNSEIVVATFLLPTSALQKLLPPGLSPLEFVPGFGGVSIYVDQNYEISDLAPYNEWGLTIPVLDSSLFEGYIPLWAVRLVLNSEVPVWAGIVGWGLPKNFGNTHCKHVAPKGIKCMVEEDDQLIMKLEVNLDGMVSTPAASPVVFLSTKDGYLVRSPSAAAGETFVGGTGTVPLATLQLGDHPFAQTLKALGLGDYPAVTTSYTPSSSSTLDRPLCQPLSQ